jgi:hypothetical protein
MSRSNASCSETNLADALAFTNPGEILEGGTSDDLLQPDCTIPESSWDAEFTARIAETRCSADVGVAFSLPLGFEMDREAILSTISSPGAFTRVRGGFGRAGAERRVVDMMLTRARNGHMIMPLALIQ